MFDLRFYIGSKFWNIGIAAATKIPTHALCVIFMNLVSLENVKKCVLGGCTITSKTKINIFWNFFFTPLAPSGPLRSKKFQKTFILAFEANSALSHEKWDQNCENHKSPQVKVKCQLLCYSIFLNEFLTYFWKC